MKFNFITKVRSDSNPNKFYTVKVSDKGDLSCNCPSWIYNQNGKRTCKHTDQLVRRGFVPGKRVLRIENDQMRFDWERDDFKICENDECADCDLRFVCLTESSLTKTEATRLGMIQ